MLSRRSLIWYFYIVNCYLLIDDDLSNKNRKRIIFITGTIIKMYSHQLFHVSLNLFIKWQELIYKNSVMMMNHIIYAVV